MEKTAPFPVNITTRTLRSADNSPHTSLRYAAIVASNEFPSRGRFRETVTIGPSPDTITGELAISGLSLSVLFGWIIGENFGPNRTC